MGFPPGIEVNNNGRPVKVERLSSGAFVVSDHATGLHLATIPNGQAWWTASTVVIDAGYPLRGPKAVTSPVMLELHPGAGCGFDSHRRGR